ncbi:hypothetical protein TNCV_2451001 [Trichonephila clavipes]|nr:hypothetical protein TNCV_2451001 [Trichonephila clavipes]
MAAHNITPGSRSVRHYRLQGPQVRPWETDMCIRMMKEEPGLYVSLCALMYHASPCCNVKESLNNGGPE